MVERPSAFLGKLAGAVVEGIAPARGIKLSDDQVAALKFINTTRSPVLVITAVAVTALVMEAISKTESGPMAADRL